ncbi:unnamed protein product [Urochloa humidicola]
MASAALPLLMAVAAILGGSARCGLASDTISADSPISGNQTIVSRGGSFELGFFTPAGSSDHSHYVGIWYKKAPVSRPTPVWVANRAAPVSDRASSKFAVAADGNLVLLNEAGELVWSSNVSSAAGSAAAVVAVILDTGNLVLRREHGGEVLWQSVEHPTDTWLPGARLGMNKITGQAQALVSWKSPGDPAPGGFSLGIDPDGSSRLFITWNGSVSWSSGEWNGDVDSILTGIPLPGEYDFEIEFVSDANASYFTYSLQDPTMISSFVLDVSGQMSRIMWMPSSGEWITLWMGPVHHCDVFAACGAFGVCSEKNNPYSCSCPAGFRPSSEGYWQVGDPSRGCLRNNPLRCNRTGNSARQ